MKYTNKIQQCAGVAMVKMADEKSIGKCAKTFNYSAKVILSKNITRPE